MRHPLLATALALTLPWAALAGPTDPVTVTPVPDVPEIFSPGIRLVADLEQAWVEEEFFVEGASTVYTYDDPPVPTGILPLEEDVPYTTRIVVRRPADPADFRGTLVIEWWNSTAGFDTAPVWDASAEFYAREGWMYVGVTNAASSIQHLVNGCSIFVGILPQTCIGRYDTPTAPTPTRTARRSSPVRTAWCAGTSPCPSIAQ
jgi:hypothetical protein